MITLNDLKQQLAEVACDGEVDETERLILEEMAKKLAISEKELDEMILNAENEARARLGMPLVRRSVAV